MTNAREDKEADKHPGGAQHKRPAPTVLLHKVKTGESADDIDGAEDDLRFVAVGKACRNEDGGAIVKEEVGSCHLLQGLENDAQHGPVKHARTCEHFPPVANGLLCFNGFLHLFEFDMDFPVIGRDPEDSSHRLLGFIQFPFAVIMFGCFRQKENTDSQNDGPEEANAHWNPPRCSVIDSFGPIIYDVGEENSERNEELVTADKGSQHGSQFT